MRVAFLVACLVLAGCVGTSHDPATPDAGVAAAMRGIVVDETVVPVAGALVLLQAGGQQAATDQDGAFSFEGLEPGRYILNVSAAGFLPQQVEAVAAASPPMTKVGLQRMVTTDARVVYAYIEGYLGCSIHVGSVVQDDVCGDVDPDVRTPLRFGERKPPSFLQAEIAWQATQEFGQRLNVIVSVAGGGRVGNVWGEGPLTCRVSTTVPCQNEDGTGGGGTGLQSVLWTDEVEAVVYADCFQTCVPGTAAGAGLALQQDYHVYASAFYQMEPDPDWTFIADGEHPQ